MFLIFVVDNGITVSNILVLMRTWQRYLEAGPTVNGGETIEVQMLKHADRIGIDIE